MQFDLIIIGGGVMGAFHAYHALERGLKVALCEKDQIPKGATVRNFGQIVPSGMNRKWQAYGRSSLDIYRSIQRQFDITLRQEGSLYVASDAEERRLLEELHQINREKDYPSQLWTARQCRERYPALRPDYCRAGLFFPQELSVNPQQMIHRLQAFLRQNDRFHHFAKTLVCEVDADARVRTSCGKTLRGERVIVCSGSECELLFPEIFAAGDLEIVKLQMLRLYPQSKVRLPGNILTGQTIRRYESFRECPSYSKIKSREPQKSFWKQWGVHILLKQEIDGSIILGDSHEYADLAERDQLDFTIKSWINRFFLEEAAKIVDLDHWEVDAQWLGFYSQCKQGDLFQRRIDDRVHLITGIGGKGMTASPGLALENIKQIFAHA